MVDVYFWRQFLVEISLLLHAISNGLVFTFPGILNPVILSPNATDIRATPDQASWIASSNGITGIVGLFILSPLMQTFGRKATFIWLNVTDLIGWIILPYANSVTYLFIARLIHGLSKGGVFINGIIAGEYADPKRRGYFMTMTKAFLAVGALLCHSLSLFMNWRQIAMVGGIPSFLAIVLTYFWEESPSYLAMKGRFEECEKNFFWFHEDNTDKREELLKLIKAQAERIEKKNMVKKNRFKKLIMKFFTIDFFKPVLLVSLLTMVIDICGRYYFMAYVIDIMLDLIGDKSLAVYSSIVSDVLAITALLMSSYIITIYKRRSIIFSFGIAANLLMFLISFVVFLKSQYSIGVHLIWLSPCLILLLVFIVNLSLIPVCFTVSGEIFPLEHRGFGSCVSGVIFIAFYILSIKITPIMMNNLQLQGTYGIYGTLLGICLVLLYYVLPETNNKTLQDIEDEIRGIDRSMCKSELIFLNKEDLERQNTN